MGRCNQFPHQRDQPLSREVTISGSVGRNMREAVVLAERGRDLVDRGREAS